MNSKEEGGAEVHRGMYSLDAIAGTYKNALTNLTCHKIIGGG